jgi:hypothetical protein
MATVLRFLLERRKFVVLSVLFYGVAFHLIYSRYWKTGAAVGADALSPMGAVVAGNSPQQQSPPPHRPASAADDEDAFNSILARLWRHLPAVMQGNSGNPSSKTTDVDEASDGLFDVHIEDVLLGHTGEVAGGRGGTDHSHSVAPSAGKRLETVIAIGGGITSRGVHDVTAASDFAAKFQFFHVFLPTFCMTANPNFTYRFYLAYDHTDPVFANGGIAAGFSRTFDDQMAKLCSGPRGIRTSLHLVQCSHSGFPTWAQNDAMLEAYIDHVDYFYRINDDTRFVSGGVHVVMVTVGSCGSATG